MRKIRRELDASSSAIPDRIEQSEPAASANQKPQSQQSCRVMNPLKTILVPVDFSTVSRTALDQAARLAGLNGASLHVLHLVDTAAVDIFLHVWREPELNLPYAHAPFGAAVPMTPPAISGDYLQTTESALRDFVSEASRDIESRALIVQTSVCRGRHRQLRYGGDSCVLILMGRAPSHSATMAKWSRFGRVWGWVFWAGLTACFVVEAMQPGSILPFWGVCYR
jgi:nucleotide-binding universal stress UspA family protein